MKKFNIDECERLCEVLRKLDSVDECKKFLEDVCTIKELQDISQRLEVAELLSEGKNYQDISKETGASATTISRVNKCLNYGKGGYVIALEKLGKTLNDET